MLLIKFYKFIQQYLSPQAKVVDLDKSQWWSYKKLDAFQNDRLKNIITYAYSNIPGYRRKFDQVGVNPEDILTKQDLKRIPIVEREELQNNWDFVNKKLIYTTLHTGGSTGTSLEYYDSKESCKIRLDSHLRGWSWNGYTPGVKMAVIASSRGQLQHKNTLTLTGVLTSANLKKSVKKLKEFKPEYLRGYVGSLYILAKYCLDNNIILSGIKAINPVSENLYDYQRKTMEEAFHCKVFEEYVCNDGGATAFECEAHAGLHYFMERSIIEEIDGDMIVTDLWNKAMPFIRYRNGDSVKFLNKKCPCGRALPLIQVKGRTNDLIITRKGIVSPTFLMWWAIGGITDSPEQIFRSGIRAVQYIQKPNFVVHVNVVKNSWCTDKELKQYKKELNRILSGMKIKINYVNDIPTTKRGKRAFIINEDTTLLKKWK